MSTWISVKDELPEEDKRVLWCGPQGGMVVARFYCGIASSGRVMVRTGGKNFFATHWIPLPDPPEEMKHGI